MINQFFLMNGYGPFVWSAFGFTIFSFMSLYLVTKFELAKEQKKFISKFGKLPREKVVLAKQQKINKEILAKSLNLNF
tara:strand:+ start:1023 stop:1256 length:234 start_codon:yes stop_codon:yes gene_type:complete